MSKKNDDFFVEKKPWSKVKDELLGCYLKPYLAKILHTRKPVIYIDCFAGKGKFDDGSNGSPLIAMQIINECKQTTRVENPQVLTAFIDLNYASELETNLSPYANGTLKIVSGKYEDHIETLLSKKSNCNVFLYIDPYGIKALRCSIFDKLSTKLNTIELLINMNSFGFIREACRAMGTSFEDKSIFDDLIEYAPPKMDTSDESIRELNEIVGGDYWQTIIAQYKSGEIDGYDAEKIFAEQYCQRLSESYTYVLNMPLRIQQGQRQK